jgi:hypothetical protein
MLGKAFPCCPIMACGADMVLRESSPNSEQSGCLVAVDLSCIEATELAAKILPVTAAVYGRSWFYLINGRLPSEKFVDPLSDETIVEIRDATAEFSNIGTSEIEIGKLLKAVRQLAAHTLERRYCEGAIDGDAESLIQSLDHVANAQVVERILVWLDHPPAEA